MSIHNEIKKKLTKEEIDAIVSLAVDGFMELQCEDKPDHKILRRKFGGILRICEIPYKKDGKQMCNLEKYVRDKIRFYKNKMAKLKHGIDIESIEGV